MNEESPAFRRGSVNDSSNVPTWLPCERCGRTGSPSLIDARLCETCLPDPEVAQNLRRATRIRHVAATRAARESLEPAVWDERADPLDDEHRWLWQAGWGRAHLFELGAATSGCGKVWVAGRVQPETPVVDPDRVRGCKQCQRAWRAGRRDGL